MAYANGKEVRSGAGARQRQQMLPLDYSNKLAEKLRQERTLLAAERPPVSYGANDGPDAVSTSSASDQNTVIGLHFPGYTVPGGLGNAIRFVSGVSTLVPQQVAPFEERMAGTSSDASDEVPAMCVCCTLIIAHTLHINCGECPATLCIQCFRMGAELGQHKRGHNYELIDPKGRPTFDLRGSWGSREESKLLMAAHRFKMGNWGEMVAMMKTDRNPHQTAEYFDKYFIRGPIGQFGLKETHWRRVRMKMFQNGTVKEHGFESKSEFKHHLMLEALRWYDEETLDSEDPALKSKVKQVTNDYIAHILAGKLEEMDIEPHRQRVFNTHVSDYDSMDPSSDEEKAKAHAQKKHKALTNGHHRHQDHSNLVHGLEQEDETDEEAHNPLPILVLKKIPKEEKGKYRLAAELRSKDRSTAITPDTRTPKEKNGRSLRILTKDRSIDKKRRATVDTSDDEAEMPSEREDELEDIKEELHGLEKEHYSDTDSSSESEVRTTRTAAKQLPPPPTPAIATPATARKKRKVTWKSKKQRRLESFEKRMNKKHRLREEKLSEIDELCPMSEIKHLRNCYPKLCMDKARPMGERPKLRQDDLSMLGYNVDRDEFEMESFNEAETLISRLILNLPTVNSRSINVENNIKFARIQKFVRVLASRNARRRAIVEHDKITEFFNFMMAMTLEKRTASEVLNERTPMDKLLARSQQTLNKEELQKLTNNIDRADALKARITKLRELQMKGVTSLKGFEKDTTATKKKPKTKKISAENKRKAGLRWKAIQRWHQKQFANGE